MILKMEYPSSVPFIVVVILAAVFSSDAAESNCTGGCTCSVVVPGDDGIMANCKVTKLEELMSFISRPFDVKSLDLSSSELPILPKGAFTSFTRLVNLSLDNTKLQTIEDGAFNDLNNLELLNLSGNQLGTWEGNFTNELSSLLYLDVTANPGFTLPSRVLTLRKLKQIKGVVWNGACANCSLVRNYDLQNKDLKSGKVNIETSELQKGEYLVGKKTHCRLNKHKVSGEVVEFAKNGFFPRCLEKNKQCFESEIQVIPIHRCWDIDNKILNIAYFISPPAMVLNLIVVVVTLTTAALRRNVALLLTTNMAVADFVLSLYTVAIISARKMSYTEFLVILDDLCNSLGFMWMVGQIVSISTSILLTIERYMVIIYCMKPNIRMTRRIALGCAAFTWLIAIIVAILPLLKISVYTSNTFCVPIRPIKDIPHSYELSIGLVMWGILLYITTIPLYVKIYLAVKRSGERIGIKRDGALAKKIAILVLSNFMFFLLPILIILIWVVTNIDDHLSPQSREILTGVLGTLCFSFNSFLNPLLYAFRVEKFKKALVMKVNVICLRKPRSQSLSTSHHSNVNQGKPRGPTISSTDGENTNHAMKESPRSHPRPGSIALNQI